MKKTIERGKSKPDGGGGRGGEWNVRKVRWMKEGRDKVEGRENKIKR